MSKSIEELREQFKDVKGPTPEMVAKSEQQCKEISDHLSKVLELGCDPMTSLHTIAELKQVLDIVADYDDNWQDIEACKKKDDAA